MQKFRFALCFEIDMDRDRNVSLAAALGCGVALGIGGFYTYYRSTKNLNKQLGNLTDSIEGLKREVEELRVASQRGTPVPMTPNTFGNLLERRTLFQDTPDTGYYNRLNGDHFGSFPNRNDLQNEDNEEEFFDVAEG